MRLIVICSAVLSALVILIPTVLGLIRTQEHFVAQGDTYQDDGYRFILPPGRSLDSEAESLVHGLFVCCSRESFMTAATAAEWLEFVEMQGWPGTQLNTQSLSRIPALPADSYLIAELRRGTSSMPVLVLEADGRFITAYEPGPGFVLYRRHRFEETWSGLAIAVERPAGVDPDR